MPDRGAGPDESDSARAVAQQAGINAAPAPAAAPPGAAVLGRDFLHGENLLRAARFARYERQPGDALYRPLRIYTSDPLRSAYEGAVATVAVPYEPLLPGPIGAHLVVEDTAPGGPSYPGVDLEDKAILLQQGRSPAPGDFLFHQQMVYAVCASIIDSFTVALGRDPSWGFDRPGDPPPDRLRIRPHYARDANAYYDKASGELRFGYFAAEDRPGPGVLPRGTVYSCMSHDVVAHEMTHALLDGMRSRFTRPTNPDVLAFHEAFADLVAILEHFGHKEPLRRSIERSGGALGPDGLLFAVAEQFGKASGSSGPLRIALGGKTLTYDGAEEPHERGGVLVQAILAAMTRIFERRVRSINTIHALSVTSGRGLHPDIRDLLADAAAKTASQFLYLCIRAIDYCPPVDITFGEYLRALVTADHDLVEDDPLGYRESLIAAFAERAIFPPDVEDLSEPSLLWGRPQLALPEIEALSLSRLQLGNDPARAPDGDEIVRQAAALAGLLTDPRYRREFGLADPPAQTPVLESIRTIRRVGPDRQVRFGLVAEVIQQARLSTPAGEVDCIGGATVILGARGEVRFVIRKSAGNAERAARQAAFRAGELGRRQVQMVAGGAPWAALHAARR
ncbi:MAG: hypothetical protein U1E53_03330 [Dongiaceae bacterium]